MTETIAAWRHDKVLLDPRSDEFESVTVAAVVGEFGLCVTIGDYHLGPVEARAIAASLLLAADRIDPDHLDRRLRDDADAELTRLVGGDGGFDPDDAA